MRALWIGALLIGCGGKADTALTTGQIVAKTCDAAFDPCGGDPMGTWTLAGVCDPAINTDQFDCPGANYDVTVDRSSGKISFKEGAEYARKYTIDLDFDLEVPTECMNGLECDSLVTFSEGLLSSCVDSGTGCDCKGTYFEDIADGGEWSVDGDFVITDGAKTAFCIEGKTGATVDPDGIRIIWTR